MELGGHLFAKDFPEIVQEIERSRQALGRWIAAEQERAGLHKGAGDVVRDHQCESGGFAGNSLDAHACDVYRGSDLAAGQGGIRRYVDRDGVRPDFMARLACPSPEM